jgi:hypothetical protein
MKILKYPLFFIVACLLILLVDYVFLSFMIGYARLGIIMQIIITVVTGTVGLALISFSVCWVAEYISEILPNRKFTSRTFILLSIINAIVVLIDIWQLKNLGIFATIVFTILMLFITFSFCSVNIGGKLSEIKRTL